MKILVTGITGQLGHDVMKALTARGHEAVGASRKEFSLTDFDAARAFVEHVHPDAIIHCAAYTAVDKAEDEQNQCMTVNGGATRNRGCRAGYRREVRLYLDGLRFSRHRRRSL